MKYTSVFLQPAVINTDCIHHLLLLRYRSHHIIKELPRKLAIIASMPLEAPRAASTLINTPMHQLVKFRHNQAMHS